MGLAEGIALLIVAAAIGLLGCNAGVTLACGVSMLMEVQVMLLNAGNRVKGWRQRGGG